MWTAENKIMTLPKDAPGYSCTICVQESLLKFLRKSYSYTRYNPWLNNVLWILTKNDYDFAYD